MIEGDCKVSLRCSSRTTFVFCERLQPSIEPFTKSLSRAVKAYVQHPGPPVLLEYISSIGMDVLNQ